jgi:hypothetical protein
MMRRHAHAAASVGPPLWLAYAANTQAVVALAERRLEVALDAAERALRLAEQAASGTLEAVALTYAPSAVADARRVGAVCAYALDVIVRNRLWHVLDVLLETLAHYWSRQGDIEGTAVTLGFHDARARVAFEPQLAVALEAVRHDPEAAAAPGARRGDVAGRVYRVHAQTVVSTSRSIAEPAPSCSAVGRTPAGSGRRSQTAAVRAFAGGCTHAAGVASIMAKVWTGPRLVA